MFIPCDPVITTSPVVGDTCFELNFDNLGYIMHDPQLDYPFYNPLDHNEIIVAYASEDAPDLNWWYVKINFCTGEYTWAFSAPPSLGQAHWSKQDWLVLGINGPLHTFKSNGDSLTYLNPASGIPNLTHATWIEGGNKIFCYAGNTLDSNVILSKNGISLDTIPYRIGRPSNLGSNIAGYRVIDGKYYITLYNLYSSTITDITNIPYIDPAQGYSMYSVDWLNANEIIWSDSRGIQKVNIHEGNIVYLKESCDSRKYGYLSTSPLHNGDFLISRQLTNMINDTAYIRHEILKINAYTGEEWVVNIAQ